jgi:hypothetical protein
MFGGTLQCPNVAQLPVIGKQTAGEFEVLAPGSVYQPLLLQPPEGDRWNLAPGTLNDEERRFVDDLVRYLYPSGEPPKALGAPLRWGDKQVFLRRNLDREPGSFRLRVDDSDWYYPDFIVWIVDHAARVQTFGFVDPKGLVSQVRGGWSDYKMVSTLYMPYVVEQALYRGGAVVDQDGEPWTFRIRGVLVSTSSFLGMTNEAKYKARDAQNSDVTPDKAALKRGRIVFQEDAGYIAQVLDLLTRDTPLDKVMQRAATVSNPPADFKPLDHTDYYLLNERERFTESDCAYAEQVTKHLLLSTNIDILAGAATNQAQVDFNKLLERDPQLRAKLGGKINEPMALFEVIWRANHPARI